MYIYIYTFIYFSTLVTLIGLIHIAPLSVLRSRKGVFILTFAIELEGIPYNGISNVQRHGHIILILLNYIKYYQIISNIIKLYRILSNYIKIITLSIKYFQILFVLGDHLQFFHILSLRARQVLASGAPSDLRIWGWKCRAVVASGKRLHSELENHKLDGDWMECHWIYEDIWWWLASGMTDIAMENHQFKWVNPL